MRQSLLACVVSFTILFAGCSPPDTPNGGADSGETGSNSSEYTDAALKTFAENLIAGDFEAAHACLSNAQQARQDVQSMEQLWNENVAELGTDIAIIETDLGSLPETPDEYGFQSHVPRSDWVNWAFVTVGEEYAVDIRGLTVKENGRTVVEYYEYGFAD
ncbi:MAG: hypothetical protein AAF456_05315 [Planctomycetota bacterium]